METTSFYFAKLYSMRQLVETDFDKFYEAADLVNADTDGCSFRKANVQAQVKAVPGIYMIYRLADDGNFHRYIGQAKNLRARLLKHLSSVNYIKDNPRTEENSTNSIYKDSPALHSAMCLHDDFYFKILCFCSKEELNRGDYNLTPGGQDGTVTHTTAVEQ